MPEIPEEILESEIEFIQIGPVCGASTLQRNAARVEFIKYLNNESFEKPCCSELGSDSLDLLIEELKKMVAIWKEKNQAARTLRNGSTFCERVPSRNKGEENKIERRHLANSDKSCKTHAKE